MTKPKRTALCLSAAAWALLAPPPAVPARQAPHGAVARALAAKLNVAGLPNLAQVSERLYRGAQPKKAGYAKLKEMGIDIVVNLRHEKDAVGAERAEVEQLGLRYVSMPWPSREKATNQQVAEFLELLERNPEKTFFVHCQRGADRTGVMVAAYRIAIQNWTVEQALEEMERFGFHGIWHRHMKKYIRGFPKQLDEDPRLRALRRSANPAP